MASNVLKDAVKDALNESISETELDETGAFYTSPDDDGDEISAADALIDEIRGEDETTVNVYRIGAGRGKETFLFSASPDDITAKDIMERCRDQHGGGDFKMVTRDARRIVKSARFSVEAVEKPATAEKREEFGASALIAMMQQSNAQMMGMFQSTMAAMAEALRGGSQPAFNPTEATRTIMESVAAMKALSDAPKDTSGQDMVKMLIQGIELAKGLVPKEGETNTNDLLAKAMDFLPSLAQAAARAPGAPPHNAPGAPGAPLDPELQAAQQREIEMNREKMAWTMNVNMLLGWAKQGRDPSLYAEMILDQVGEEKVLEFVAAPDALKKLAQYNGEVMAYAPWFEALKREILALTEPDPESDTPLDGELMPEGPPDAVQNDPDTGNTGGTSRGNGGST